MKLVLYSGIHTDELTKKLLNFCGKSEICMTIIPSDSKHPKSQIFFEWVKSHFNKHGVTNIKYYPIDDGNPIDKGIFENSDVIYLSGWDTLSFYKNLKTSGNFEELRSFAKMPGKVLCGLSAGSILMTPNLWTDNAADIEWLGLVNFEIYPHFNEDSDDLKLSEYGSKTENIVLALPDNAWITIDTDSLDCKKNYIWEGIRFY